VYTVSGGELVGKDDLGDLKIGNNIEMYLAETRCDADR
jgi:hypothetical protein